MLRNKYLRRIILFTTTGLLILAMALGGIIGHQNNKINDLKDQLYLKQQNEQRTSDHYESIINVKTIQSKFNTLQEYAVQKNNLINKNHTYYYTADGIMGLDKKATLAGHGMMRYDIVVNLRNAIITQENGGRTIKIQIEKPYVDDTNVSIMNNSIVMDKEQYNFWANKADSAQAQKLFMESFEDSGKKDIIDLYSTKDKQDYINKVAIAEVQALIQTLHLNGNVAVVVDIID